MDLNVINSSFLSIASFLGLALLSILFLLIGAYVLNVFPFRRGKSTISRTSRASASEDRALIQKKRYENLFLANNQQEEEGKHQGEEGMEGSRNPKPSTPIRHTKSRSNSKPGRTKRKMKSIPKVEGGKRTWDQEVDFIISTILLVTIRPCSLTSNLFFIQTLADEKKERGDPLLLNSEDLDECIISGKAFRQEKGSTSYNTSSSFGYFVKCFERLSVLRQADTNTHSHTSSSLPSVTLRNQLFDSLSSTIIGYALLQLIDVSLTCKDAFIRSKRELKSLLESEGSELSRALHPGFLLLLLQEGESEHPSSNPLNVVFAEFLEEISRVSFDRELWRLDIEEKGGHTMMNRLLPTPSSITLSSAMNKGLRLLNAFAKQPLLVNLICSRSDWMIPEVLTGIQLEQNSFLGRIFGLGVRFNDLVQILYKAQRYQPKHQGAILLSNIVGEVQRVIRNAQDLLCTSASYLLPPDSSQAIHHSGSTYPSSTLSYSQSRMLSWIILALRLNIPRARVTFMPAIILYGVPPGDSLENVSTNSFMASLVSVMLFLVKEHKTTRSRINLSFCASNACKEFYDESPPTLLGGKRKQEEVMKIITTSSSSAISCFETKIFFSLHLCLHVGLIPILFEYFFLLEKAQEALQLNRKSAMLELRARAFALRAVNISEEQIVDVAEFYEATCSLLLKDLSFSHSFSSSSCFLIPEHILYDMLTFFKFFQRFSASSHPENSSIPEIARYRCFLSLLSSLSFQRGISNPHIRMRIPETLSIFLPQDFIQNRHTRRVDHRGERHTQFQSISALELKKHPFFVTSNDSGDIATLIPSLIEIFVEAGTSPDFLDTRYFTALLLGFLDHISFHHNNLINAASNTSTAHQEENVMEGSDNSSIAMMFRKFVHILSSDFVYLFDEAISKLEKIHIEEEGKSDASQDTVRAGHLAREAATFMQLANECMSLMHQITGNDAIAKVFVSTEFAQRTALMLDVYIRRLASKKITELKVKDPVKYHFNPGMLLTHVIGTFVQLAQCSYSSPNVQQTHMIPLSSSLFLESVALDVQSYDPDVFERALSLVSSHHLLDNDVISAFQIILKEVKTLFVEFKDIDFSDAPSRFTCQINDELMRDPVLLPGISRVVVDKSSIIRWLLDGHTTDPFSRKPLTLADLIPQEELRKEILEYIRSKTVAAAAARKRMEKDEEKGA